jgi:hypothetical protein
MYPRAGGDEVDSVDVWRVDFAPLRALVAGPGVTFCPFCGDALIMRGGVYFCVRGSMDCSARLTEALTRLAPDGPPDDEPTGREWFCPRCGRRHAGYVCPECRCSLWSVRWDLIEIHSACHAPR